ncbi:unnamed protein product, partial [Ectocarpus sp. 12 AP-2014]
LFPSAVPPSVVFATAVPPFPCDVDGKAEDNEEEDDGAGCRETLGSVAASAVATTRLFPAAAAAAASDGDGDGDARNVCRSPRASTAYSSPSKTLLSDRDTS